MAPQQELIEALARVSLRVQGEFERSAATHGVSTVQARLLEILRGRAPTINELAGLLALDKSSTSGLVDRAQRRGLVRRVPSQLDRRSVRVRLTDQGRVLAEDLADQVSRNMRALLDQAPAEEHAALTTLLNQIAGPPSDSPNR